MIPKAELHVHLEGTASPELIMRLAKRNKVELPNHLFANGNEFAWETFLQFLDTYELACQAIKQPEDYYDITYEYLAACARQGTIYVEMMYSPEHAERSSGIASHHHVAAMEHAIKQARQDFAIEGRIIITCVRHYGVESTIKVAKQAADESSWCVVGFGMGGDEQGYPPAQFAPAYEIANKAGLACTVHAGETAGPQSVREAIQSLPIQRIGHGVRAIEDPALIREIVNRKITLEVCPKSNIATRVYTDFSQHPLVALINQGVKVTLNSDDPPYFATSIGEEYRIAKEVFGLDNQVLLQLTVNAIEASFADSITKHQLLEKVKTYQALA